MHHDSATLLTPVLIFHMAWRWLPSLTLRTMTTLGCPGPQCFADATETVPSGPSDLRACKEFGGIIQLYGGPYEFGVDPAWRGTKTELPYLNSLKMKMSIIIGVIHMNLGILQSLNNNNFFRDRLSTICEFVPQMLFLNGLFGYLSFLIIYKWCSGGIADLYHVLIFMFLKPGVVDEAGLVYGDADGNLQATIQVFLLVVAFVAVPWMLLPKPLILKKRHEVGGMCKMHLVGERSAGIHAICCFK